MDLTTFNWLRSAAGAEILADLANRELRESAVLPELERLRRSLPAEHARAAVELALLRQRAAPRFPNAERLFFTREALEQASAAPVAAHRAARMAGIATIDSIADLCCGIGGDALAFAAAGLHVTAVDRDPLRLAMVQANADMSGLADRVTILTLDLLRDPPPQAGALFCDPGRRAGGRRRFHSEAYEPPLSQVLRWRRPSQPLAIKLAPGIDPAELPTDAELEFVSLDGDLKEAVIWYAPDQVRRRATLLRRSTNDAVHHVEMTEHSVINAPPTLSTPRNWLYEPDPAVIRAGLVRELATRLGLAQLDPSIAYLTGDQFVATPFARGWPIYEWLPFQLKRLNARLRELDAGAVTVKKRGSPLDTDILAKRLSGTGTQALVVTLTQLAGKPIALICGPPHTAYR
ncbi:MAG: SAM-dependent methyltransferase [Oscillochloris sp.]|nr:SAM-dependent methyltransferase [Oscillochloris sp.]